MRLRLATRGSTLAWTQSGTVAAALRELGHEVELVRITTAGDVSSAPLASLGGTGVFVGAVRAAVLSGSADLAVHSFKDLPTAPASGLLLGAVPEREDPSDALCTRDGRELTQLPQGARVGTGSPRRAAQLLAVRPDLEIVELRGNVETRLGRIERDLDAVVLAAAGLHRLGLGARISELLSGLLPAPAQGALAVECRSDAPAELLTALGALDHAPTRLAALAERAVLARLEAGCAAPVGALAEVAAGRLSLTARVVALDGQHSVQRSAQASALDAATAVALGTEVATALLAAGAAELADLASAKPGPLAGRRVLVPHRAPAGLTEALAKAGAGVTTAEFTRRVQLPTAALEQELAREWDWIVVSSAATASPLAVALAATGRAAPPIAAVGPATASALVGAGLHPALVADPGGGAALASAFPPGPGRILLPGAETASAEPAAGLAAKGWTVTNVAVYRTVAIEPDAALLAAWADADLLVVTSGSVARAAALAGPPGPKVVAIGASAAAAATKAGLAVAAVASTPTTDGLVAAACEALAPS